MTQTEVVQHSVTKRLPGIDNLSYKDRLSLLGAESLKLRRVHFDLKLAYNIIFGLIDIKY